MMRKGQRVFGTRLTPDNKGSRAEKYMMLRRMGIGLYLALITYCSVQSYPFW